MINSQATRKQSVEHILPLRHREIGTVSLPAEKHVRRYI